MPVVVVAVVVVVVVSFFAAFAAFVIGSGSKEKLSQVSRNCSMHTIPSACDKCLSTE